MINNLSLIFLNMEEPTCFFPLCYHHLIHCILLTVMTSSLCGKFTWENYHHFIYFKTKISLSNSWQFFNFRNFYFQQLFQWITNSGCLIMFKEWSKTAKRSSQHFNAVEMILLKIIFINLFRYPFLRNIFRGFISYAQVFITGREMYTLWFYQCSQILFQRPKSLIAYEDT